ncbi:MAG: oligosaccharide flippase family protein [Clostridia bacterium]|nr:oligosaccharide flippase family protein [Clostridia bacterium]
MKNFFKTVAIVTVFSVCEKVLGFAYRIFLSRTIGSEGVGMYQVALSVFAFLLTLICSGTPITVSRLMTKYKSENQPQNATKIISAGLLLTLLISLPICIFFLLCGKYLTFIFADERCFNIFLVLLPGLIFTSLYSVFRGVFWGNKDFLPYSVIELLEEICMIIAGVILISKTTSTFEGALKAGLAVLISYIFSFSVATFIFFYRKNRLVRPKEQMKVLLSSAVPVTAMRTVNSLSMSLVSIILPLRLIVAGYSKSSALSLYGSAFGQAMPILFIPTTLIGSLTVVLVPEIAEDFYSKKNTSLKTEIEKAIKFTTFITCVFIPIFFVCGEEIGIIIFDNLDCGKYLSVSSFIMIFMGLSNLTTSILNSIGLENKVLICTTISGLFMIASVFFLPKILGIYSLLVGFTFVYGITCIYNLYLINKHCPVKPKIKRYILVSSLLIIPSSFLGLMLEKLLLSILGTTFTFIICAVIITIFTTLLFVGFNLIDFNFIKSRFRIRKSHSEKRVAIQSTN